MTLDEYRKALEGLTNEEFAEFNDNLGGNPKTREERVKDFAQKPENERLICYLLKLKTENEKLIESAMKSANAADKSSKIAIIACVASIAAAIAAFMKLN